MPLLCQSSLVWNRPSPPGHSGESAKPLSLPWWVTCPLLVPWQKWNEWPPASLASCPSTLHSRLAEAGPIRAQDFSNQYFSILGFEINLVVVKQPFIRNEGEQVEKISACYTKQKYILFCETSFLDINMHIHIYTHVCIYICKHKYLKTLYKNTHYMVLFVLYTHLYMCSKS